jgi:hypothetical protein
LSEAELCCFSNNGLGLRTLGKFEFMKICLVIRYDKGFFI